VTASSIPTDIGRRVTALEGLRALAVLAVVITHAGFLTGVTGGTTFPGLVARMDFGVAVFFVLSGYLLYLPHARRAVGSGRAPSLRDYAVRRFARIYPAFLLCLLGTFFLVPVARKEPLADWLATMLLGQTLDTRWQIPPLNHLWSLSTEVSFYITLPAIAWVLRAGRPRHKEAQVRRQVGRLAALMALAWTFRIAVGAGLVDNLAALSWLPAHLDWFAAGMFLAVVQTSSRAGWTAALATAVRDAPIATRATGCALLWLATTHLAGPYDLRPATGPQDLFKHLLYLAAASTLVAPAALRATTGVDRMLSKRPVVWLGTISYAVFLWHLPIMFVVQNALGLRLFAGGFWPVLGLTLAATIPVAAASWYLAEHPALRTAHALTRAAPDPVLPKTANRVVSSRS
jgi:peptidoglycan/LPS O-acetylase OafA/YrhL